MSSGLYLTPVQVKKIIKHFIFLLRPYVWGNLMRDTWLVPLGRASPLGFLSLFRTKKLECLRVKSLCALMQSGLCSCVGRVTCGDAKRNSAVQGYRPNRRRRREASRFAEGRRWRIRKGLCADFRFALYKPRAVQDMVKLATK